MANVLPGRPPIQPRTTKPGPYTVEAAGSIEIAGETKPRRHPSAKEALREEPEPGIATVFDVLKRSTRKFGDANAIGSRRVIATHTETKQIKDQSGKVTDKQWSYYQLSDYEYISFNEFERRALTVGSAMRNSGLQKYDRVEIYAATSAYWFTVAHGASSQTITISTAYDTLGEEGLSHSLIQSQAKAIFTDPALLPCVTKALAKATKIRTVVYNSDAPQPVKQSDLDEFKRSLPNVKIMAFDEFLHMGAQAVDPVPPTPDDLLCIMYTSGSTGPPKGALLKHKTVVASMAGVNCIVEQYISPGDRILAYLPLAHIIEFVYENLSLYWGTVMGYGSPRTLTDQSVRKCEGDIRALKPGFMVGVPAVWDAVKKGILGRIGPPTSLKARIFWGAFYAKRSIIYWGLPGAQLFDTLIFNQIKEATGGNLRLVMSGGGPTSKATQEFISYTICPMLTGYGLTETAGNGSLNQVDAWTSSSLGPMTGAVEVKLVDVPDLNYFSSHQPPQGEVWIRGSAVIEGYLDNPDENAKAFQDGWFKTGDIGEFDPSGQLRIIDRKKNLVKTLNGEYIALEKLESIYRSAPVVANICVYASADYKKPIALISPAEAALRQIAKGAGVDESASLHELCGSDKICAAVCKELVNAGREGGLQSIELVQNVVITEQEWTPQNQLLTSSQKLNRKVLLETFSNKIEAAYKSSSG